MSASERPEEANPGVRRAWGRLFALVSLVVLLTSRVMLLAHEFVGHGLVATLFGGRVDGWWLFLFAGGRVSYDAPFGSGRRVIVSLGGVVLEILIGLLALWIARKRQPFTAFCLYWGGGVVLGHGAAYLARGTHYGFGDGAGLARVMGSSREVVVLLASALTIAASLVCARRLAAYLASLLSGSRRRLVVLVFCLFAGAGIVHGVLARIEVRYFPDPAWVAIMEEAAAVQARAEVARQIAEAKRRGEPVPSVEDRKRMIDELERANRPWPLDPVLLVAVLGAFVLGAWRGVKEPITMELPSWRRISVVGAGLGAMVLVILGLRLLGR